MEKEILTVLDLYDDQFEHLCYYTARMLDKKAFYSKYKPTIVTFDKYITLFCDCFNVDHIDVICYPFTDNNGKFHSNPNGIEVYYKEN